MFQKRITVTANNHYSHLSNIYLYLSILSLFLMTPPSFSFLFIYFLLCWTLEKLVIMRKSFWNKDEISFLNPLSMFRFVHFSTYFFTYCQIYKIYIFSINIWTGLALNIPGELIYRKTATGQSNHKIAFVLSSVENHKKMFKICWEALLSICITAIAT